jgi:hypothetical protein
VQDHFAAPSADYQTFRDHRFDSELIPRKAAERPCGADIADRALAWLDKRLASEH